MRDKLEGVLGILETFRKSSRRKGDAPKCAVYMVTAEVTALKFLPGLLKAMVEKGFSVTVAASGGNRLVSMEGPGVKAVPVSMRRDPSPVHDLVSLFNCLRLLRAERPGVVITATPKASLLGMLAGALMRVPVRQYQVWGLRYETEVGLRRVLLLMMERITMSLATDVVCNSPSLVEEVRVIAPRIRARSLGQGSSHGVDLKHFSRERFEGQESVAAMLRKKSPGCVLLGFVGRIHKDKGLDTLLDALLLVNTSVPIALVVVGHGEDEELEKRLGQGLPTVAVEMVGSVPDTAPWFAAMDIHVLPTLREGFPNVVLEASAMEVPTITTTATGARDSVVDGETGILVPPGDAPALAKAIEILVRDPERRFSMGKSARDRAVEEFAQERIWQLQADSVVELEARGSRA